MKQVVAKRVATLLAPLHRPPRRRQGRGEFLRKTMKRYNWRSLAGSEKRYIETAGYSVWEEHLMAPG